MFQMSKFLNTPRSDSVFRIFQLLDLIVSEFVSDFDIRISDFICWRLGALNHDPLKRAQGAA
jgi:hypothetical protein